MRYTTSQIRDFIRCPQFGDTKYGKWGTLKLEVRETLKDLVDALESAEYIIKNQQQRIDKAIEYITSVNLDDSDNIEDLLKILEGEDK